MYNLAAFKILPSIFWRVQFVAQFLRLEAKSFGVQKYRVLAFSIFFIAFDKSLEVQRNAISSVLVKSGFDCNWSNKEDGN